MKRLLYIICLMALSSFAFAEDFIVTEAQYVVISGNVSDTVGRTMITPDSIRIVVTDSAGTELFDDWFNSGDAQASLNGDMITFFDQWEDINGAASVGIFHITATIASDADNDIDVYSNQNYTLRGVATTTEATYASVAAGGTSAAQDIMRDSISALVDSSQSGGGVAKEATLTIVRDTANAALAVSDTTLNLIKYTGGFGLGIYIDSTISNTNTVLGIDGTIDNPVSTLTAARTLADQLETHTYYFQNASTFLDGANDLSASHFNWRFVGRDFQPAIGVGNQRVDGSLFFNMKVSGAMHASGGQVRFFETTIEDITQNFVGRATECWLAGTIVTKSDREIQFNNCRSDVPDPERPIIDLSGGSSLISFRLYSGTVQFSNGSATDTLTLDNIGGIIIDNTNNDLFMTLHGIMDIEDNGTGTLITKTAALNLPAIAEEVADSVWRSLFEDRDGLAGSFADSAKTWGAGFDTLSTAFQLRLATLLADTTWLSLLEARDGVAGSFGDSAQGWGQTAAGGSDTANIIDAFLRLVATDTVAATMWSKLMVMIDSTETAIADANKGNFKADVSALALEASLSDTLATTFVDRMLTRMADSVWLSLLEARDGTAGSFGDSAQAWGATGASATDTTNIKTMLFNNLFARLTDDTTIQVTPEGYVIVANVNEDADTLARLDDSASFQGSASGLTVQQIVDGVWDELQSAHVTAGTFGKFLDTEVSGVSSPAGDGAFSVVWVLIDSSATPDTTLRAAPLYINNVAQTSQPLFQLTDNDGEASFNLDAADWVIFTTEPGYSNNIDTFTVSGAGTDTLFVYRTAGSLTQVAFDLREANGSFLSGAFVRAELVSVNDSLLYDGTDYIFNDQVIEQEANSSGLALIDMYANSTLTNDSSFWEISIYNKRRGGRKQEYRMRVPVADTVVYPQFLTRWNRDDD